MPATTKHSFIVSSWGVRTFCRRGIWRGRFLRVAGGRENAFSQRSLDDTRSGRLSELSVNKKRFVRCVCRVSRKHRTERPRLCGSAPGKSGSRAGNSRATELPGASRTRIDRDKAATARSMVRAQKPPFVEAS